MQYKKIQIHGKNIGDFEPKRNPLEITVHTLTTTQKSAITFLVKKWMAKDEYQFLMSSDEAVELLHKLNNYIGYEEI